MQNEAVDEINDAIVKLYNSQQLSFQAEKVAEALSSDARDTIECAIKYLVEYMIAKAKLTNSSLPEIVSPSVSAFLSLLVFGVYESDELVLLPEELRVKNIEQWSQLAGTDPTVVRQVAMLGPKGLKSLIASGAEGDS